MLFHADCRDVLKSLSDNSIDSCVTDPPYALVSIVKRFGSPNAAPARGNEAYMRASAGFMGKTWDTGETAFSTEFWEEVLRVLKPGAHVAAFGASRGYHRMACAIEDAGFEIRDSLMWMYGTGFPKSQNVARFIDKEFGFEGTFGSPKSAEHVSYTKGDTNSNRVHEGWKRPWMDNLEAVDAFGRQYLPVSVQAQAYQDYGTSLKPAFEPIVLARKPLSENTIAANVLKWGTGALNIGGCRVGTGEERKTQTGGMGRKANPVYNMFAQAETKALTTVEGRWPANVIHDGSDEVVGAFPNTAPAKAAARGGKNPNPMDWGNDRADGHIVKGHSDNGGSAARFFYSAKANKTDRAGSKHPTVKPVALKEWLCTLITPPGGIVLDPFAGSGTTGQAAINKGFRYILCEREAEYVRDIKRRLDKLNFYRWNEKARVMQALLDARST